MATILLKIQASQFSIFLRAIHHMAVKADAETNESNTGVSELVRKFKIINKTAQAMMKPENPRLNSLLEHHDIWNTS